MVAPDDISVGAKVAMIYPKPEKGGPRKGTRYYVTFYVDHARTEGAAKPRHDEKSLVVDDFASHRL
jgi:hypothetical protein